MASGLWFMDYAFYELRKSNFWRSAGVAQFDYFLQHRRLRAVCELLILLVHSIKYRSRKSMRCRRRATGGSPYIYIILESLHAGICAGAVQLASSRRLPMWRHSGMPSYSRATCAHTAYSSSTHASRA